MLQLKNVDVHYGSFKALSNISMTVDTGGLVVLLGANGAGKSTLFNSISGLIKPSAGTIEFEDKTLNGMKPNSVVSAGVVQCAEGRQLFPRMSVHDNLMLGAYVHRKDKDGNRKRLNEVLELFPILEEKARQPAGSLSGGQQQMVAIGRAMMSRPRLLMLDEPSLGLAPLIVKEIFEIVRELRASGISILLIEQNARAALQIADAAYVLELGEVTMHGPAAQVASDPRVEAVYLGAAET